MTQILITLLRERLLKLNLSGKRLVIAVSGGPDSLALAVGLARLQRELGLGLHLAHLDHCLRPGSADDAEFVQAVARDLDLPVSVGRAQVREVAARDGLGLEEAARQERYRFLARICHETGSDAVAVGHTRDDQTETRLMHVVRGAGLRGLTGMAEDSLIQVPGSEPVRVIRPLLNVTRLETLAFCRAVGLTPRQDPSNLDPSYTRNRLRLDVIPSLRSVNPRLDDSLERLARSAADASDFIELELDQRIDTLVRADTTYWAVQRAGWRTLHPALKRALLQRAASALAGTPGTIGAVHVEEAIQAADTWTSGRTLCWPGNLEVHVEHDEILIRRRGARQPMALIEQTLPEGERIALGLLPASLLASDRREALTVPRSAVLELRRVASPCPGRARDRWHCDLDGAKIAEASLLAVRPRRPGDWLVPEGMVGRKKVQDLMVDAHIPRDDRDRVPIVATGESIVWVVGLRRDHRFLADHGSQQVFCLTVDFTQPEGDSAAVARTEVACPT